VTKFEDIEGKLREIGEDVHALAFGLHMMNEKLPKITEVLITPSEHKKSTHEGTFLDLMNMFGFGQSNIANIIEVFDSAFPFDSKELDYTFHWDGQQESASYEPLLKHLHDHGICAVRVSEGQNLPDGLLYREELWTLKRNTTLRCEDLRQIGKESVFKYILQGRTDLVIKKYSNHPLGKSNNRYFIEIKRVEDFSEEDSLRECVLQLIGGNASNSFHSPPVLLTNLNKNNYVLYISLMGDPTQYLSFKLNVLRMPSFGVALAFVEAHTAEMSSVTLHLGRRPTPPATPPEAKSDLESNDDEDFTESFGSVSLAEVVIDDNGKAV
jgi:hypothetical protein